MKKPLVAESVKAFERKNDMQLIDKGGSLSGYKYDELRLELSEDSSYAMIYAMSDVGILRRIKKDVVNVKGELFISLRKLKLKIAN